jgi:hypothetical protein
MSVTIEQIEAIKSLLGSHETLYRLAYNRAGAKIIPSEKSQRRIDDAKVVIAALEAAQPAGTVTVKAVYRTSTGVKDKDGNELFLGDKVRYLISGPHTKKDYWNPEYEIVWKAPAFTLKHIGGGKHGDNADFILRCGGGNGALELIERAALEHAAPAAEPVEGSPLLEWAVSKWNDEVKNRPLQNVHRRSLDDTWRQVIRWAGGDPVALLGPSHDDLLAATKHGGDHG